MKAILMAGALVVLTCAPAFAQDNPSLGTDKPAAAQNENHGTAPQDKGNTGWNGGSHVTNEAVGKAAAPSNPATVAVSDGPLGPEMATGIDLKGPPMRFPTNKTPE